MMTNADPDVLSARHPLVALSDIRIAFRTPNQTGEIQILDGLSFEVGLGEFVVVAGRSGSGKTSLLRIAAGLLVPAKGTVVWNGRALSELSRSVLAQRRRELMGIVFQSGGLLEHLTAAENVALGDLPRGVRTDGRQRAESRLGRVEFESRSLQSPSQPSGGERQRSRVAREAISDPAATPLDARTSTHHTAHAQSAARAGGRARDITPARRPRRAAGRRTGPRCSIVPRVAS